MNDSYADVCTKPLCGHAWSVHGPTGGCAAEGCQCPWNKPREQR